MSLDDLGIPGDPVEDGETFETNAAIKARFGLRASGLPTLADDSGIEVDALDGGPGVRTRRYAGEDATDEENNAKLLAALDGSAAGAPRRPLRVRARPGTPRRSRGRAAASRSSRPAARAAAGSRPSHAGPAGSATTRSSNRPRSRPVAGRSGLWTPAEKHAISHRARAARRMAPKLAALGF